MNTQDRRFLHGALLEGPGAGPAPSAGDFPREAGALRLAGVYEWPSGVHKGARTRVVKTGYASSRPQTGLVLSAPETVPATKDTVQVDFAEDLPSGSESFGLVKLRGRVVWQAEGHHILRFHRQMPVGWPEGDHHEADERALSGRTARVEWGSLRSGGWRSETTVARYTARESAACGVVARFYEQEAEQ